MLSYSLRTTLGKANPHRCMPRTNASGLETSVRWGIARTAPVSAVSIEVRATFMLMLTASPSAGIRKTTNNADVVFLAIFEQRDTRERLA